MTGVCEPYNLEGSATTLLVMSPISKFGAHLDGFYINVGG
jgi:hypothetical protein